MPGKRRFAALAAAAICAGACTSSEPAGSEPSAGASAPDVATLACTPLFAAQEPLVTCGASAAKHAALVSGAQSTITARMQSAFASLLLTPDFATNQVIITSRSAEFANLFGSQIVAPLTAGGAFTIAAPLMLGRRLAPSVSLVANVFGAVPALNNPFATPASIWSAGPLAPATAANGSFAAFNTAAFHAAALNMAPLDASAMHAATMLVTILISTPTTATTPLVCSGAVSMGCL